MNETAPPSLQDLHVRLRKLEDIEEIRDLRLTYHRFINEGDFTAVADLYTEDADVDLDVAGRASGREDIKALYRLVPDSLDFVKQFIHNHIVRVDGDQATGISYMEARYVRQGDSGMLACEFDETYRREADGWKISKTIVRIYFSVPLSKGWADGSKDFMPNWR